MSVAHFECIRGMSADREVLLGFAPANLLYKFSFADILDEDTGFGYQRPFNERHSLDFRRYIKAPNSSTIPLTLNLRPAKHEHWSLVELGNRRVRLDIDETAGAVMAQVDCQHRLGHLADLSISLPFMCFVGLSEREEMEIFGVINGKAKGLSTSLLDYHDAQLSEELAEERPELFVALSLNSTEGSPWQGRLNLGGKTTSGLKRIVSLRMMQQAVSEFLRSTKLPPKAGLNSMLHFWKAVAMVLPLEWSKHRQHVLTKGVGVYALMRIAADIHLENSDAGRTCDRHAYARALADFVDQIDWSTNGDLAGFGGQGGVKAAVEFIRDVRKRARYKVVNG